MSAKRTLSKNDNFEQEYAISTVSTGAVDSTAGAKFITIWHTFLINHCTGPFILQYSKILTKVNPRGRIAFLNENFLAYIEEKHPHLDNSNLDVADKKFACLFGCLRVLRGMLCYQPNDMVVLIQRALNSIVRSTQDVLCLEDKVIPKLKQLLPSFF